MTALVLDTRALEVIASRGTAADAAIDHVLARGIRAITTGRAIARQAGASAEL